MVETLTIARRFRGPLTSANGGYAAGLLAAQVGAHGVEVTLRAPPPLERPLRVERDGERTVLLDGGTLVAEARAADPGIAPPPSPSFAEAAAAAGPAGWGSSVFAECFVCGHRDEGDGLAIHARLVPGRDDGIVAAAWTPSEVRPELLWAAIDCPGAYALLGGARGEPVLGRMSARIDALPDPGECCVVTGWRLGSDGRKHEAGTALHGEGGRLLAVSRQLWIEPRS